MIKTMQCLFSMELMIEISFACLMVLLNLLELGPYWTLQLAVEFLHAIIIQHKTLNAWQLEVLHLMQLVVSSLVFTQAVLLNV